MSPFSGQQTLQKQEKNIYFAAGTTALSFYEEISYTQHLQ